MSLLKKIKLGAQRYNMDFDTGGLSAYTDESSDELFRRSVLEGRTISMIRVQDGVKGTAKIKLLNDSITYQAADDCSMTADGNSTIFTDRNLVTVKQGFLKTFCQDDLSGFWTRLALKAGAMAENEELIFEEELMEFILELNEAALESLVWVGDTGGSDLIDGWGTQMLADASVVEAAPGGNVIIDATNAYASFLQAARAMPAAIRQKSDATIFCGLENFDFLKDDLFSQNLFHVPVQNEENNSFILPATGIRIEQVPGLNGDLSLYAGRKSDFIFGTDLASDSGSVEMWYDKTDDLIYIRNKFYAGVNYPFSDQMVKWTTNLA